MVEKMDSVSLLAFGWHLHFVFGLALFMGMIFLVIWAIKSMDKNTLKKWTIWLLTIGVVGALLTSVFGVKGWERWHGNSMVKHEKMMNMMMDNDMMNRGNTEMMPMMDSIK